LSYPNFGSIVDPITTFLVSIFKTEWLSTIRAVPVKDEERLKLAKAASVVADPMDPEFTAQNPIVEAATKIRARRELERAIDAAAGEVVARKPEDAEESLRLFAEHVRAGSRRFNAIAGERNGVKLVVLERPLRLRLRFRDDRIALDLDEINQLVRAKGFGLDGDYQFDLAAEVPALINLSKISTEAGYGERLTASSLLKLLTSSDER
jgi:hypothetical protein